MKGFHHVSLITKNKEANRQFYEDILGLRLVKQSYHQENKQTPHLFYGDYSASTGTLVSFFEFPTVGQSYWGKDRIADIAFLLKCEDALHFWHKRLKEKGIECSDIDLYFDSLAFDFKDPDGSSLKMFVALPHQRLYADREERKSEIPLDYQIMGIGPVSLHVSKLDESVAFLKEVFKMNLLGFYAHPRNEDKYVYVLEDREGARFHVEDASDLDQQKDGRGSVDHVALTVEDIFAWEKRLDDLGLDHSGVIDRYYFKSIYVEDPSGINYELSNTKPGFLVDESLEELGSGLKKI